MSSTVTTQEVENSPTPPGEGAGAGAGSLWADAWAQLRRSPVFIVSTLIVLLVVSMALFPSLWTHTSPDKCILTSARKGPSEGHVFGSTILGCDMYTHIIYGARPSIFIAVIVTILTALIGGTLGVLSGFYGGWTDTLISRFTDVVLGLPFLLGALMFLALLQQQNGTSVSIVLVALGWTSMTRIVRGTVISLRDQDFVEASRALGASNFWLIRKHILPNALSPIIVLSTLYVGTYVSAEATLTFLGVGLQPPAISWGILVAQGEGYAVSGNPHLLIFPCAALIITVLSFILLGDVLRDALDPRGR
ncbi:ABC transporter permease [Nocardioides marmoribigeumensis]|uniref:Peptide/nickel transport system permease protein/oligopeptide transport system permease protein n=1 Tax=Nocardioides marmoribigeumensis TaxID=433649 RepID=A0ABU2BSQ1_9ACTN|nr:ABC transporter permease [Nocardioides marmoribigeumensis]MDR7361019.1 peptide/nickel transport system permease protein/oligopeptide transport system permease protein [Nocardioides marmoribigeumensis]